MRKLRDQGLNVSDCGQKNSLLKDEIWKRKVTVVEILFLPSFLIVMFHYSYKSIKICQALICVHHYMVMILRRKKVLNITGIRPLCMVFCVCRKTEFSEIIPFYKLFRATLKNLFCMLQNG